MVFDKTRQLIARLRPSKKAVLCTFGALAGILIFVSGERWLLYLGNFLVVQGTIHPGDVVHVIAGEDYRTDYALQLYEQGYGKTLFFTGGWCATHQYHHGLHARERALAQGIPLKAIAYDDSSVSSTYLEVEKLKEWLAHTPSPVRSVIVVSDPFHMRRARWSYKRVLGNQIEIQMAPVPFGQTPFKRRWWTDTASRRYVRAEYKKLAYYVLRYRISRGKFREWLASMDRG